MLTQEKIELFYKDVEMLGLKRPVSVIALKTGYSKGNVSSYLNKKLSPSENFITKFYEEFKNHLPKSSINVPRETLSAASGAIVPAKVEGKISIEANVLLDLLESERKRNDSLQQLLDVSLNNLAQLVNDNAGALKAELRAYNKYQIWKGVDFDQKEIAKAQAVVDKIYFGELGLNDLDDIDDVTGRPGTKVSSHGQR